MEAGYPKSKYEGWFPCFKYQTTSISSKVTPVNLTIKKAQHTTTRTTSPSDMTTKKRSILKKFFDKFTDEP